MTGDGVNSLIEAAWPIIAKARDEERAAVALEEQGADDDDGEPAADYNPALMPPLRESKKHKTGRTKKKRR